MMQELLAQYQNKWAHGCYVGEELTHVYCGRKLCFASLAEFLEVIAEYEDNKKLFMRLFI